MAQFVLHRANTRGHANHGWLDAHHTFSFAGYYQPDRTNFGALRVLNDDRIDGGMGFGTHPHDNMKIITIPLEGALAHKDSLGTTSVIQQGDIQVMSAGTGVQHSEYNANPDQAVKLLQIWLFPNQKNVTPRYDQLSLDLTKGHNQFQQILSPDPEDAGVWIHQDAWFSLGKFNENIAGEYAVKKAGNGIYVFVIQGEISIDDEILNTRDGMGIWDTDVIRFKTLTADTQVLLMDVPMQF